MAQNTLGLHHTQTERNIIETQYSNPGSYHTPTTFSESQAFSMGQSETMNHPSAWASSADRTTAKMNVAYGNSIGRQFGRGDKEDDDTTLGSSAATSPLVAPMSAHYMQGFAPGPGNVIGTPSTVSTATSVTDDASLGGDVPHLSALLDNQRGKQHRRVFSWDVPPSLLDSEQQGNRAFPQTFVPEANSQPWSNVHHPHQPHQRIASFREEIDFHGAYGSNEQGWNSPQMAQHHRHHQQGEPRMYRPNSAYNHTPQHHQHSHHRKAGYSPHSLSSDTPPRAPRTPPRSSPRQQRGSHVTAPSGVQPGGGSRSASEVLKTLLRKKACLYESDTSRAVSLVTWLVGRELALEFGFFSRQQLQAGVHACVASKIDSNVITRTKVNRCMQIILNSCFHYIIPRPDGTEENGSSFREVFRQTVQDDSVLLSSLEGPWDGLHINKKSILTASAEELNKSHSRGITSRNNSPDSSPHIGSTNGSKILAEDEVDGKRAVLLCFNENVRCAEDVFRYHNEFIRDTAHASQLQLSAHEWRQFFGKDTSRDSFGWDSVGVPVPQSSIGGVIRSDSYGFLSADELHKFRTSWCMKRYDHDHDLCCFAHVEVNGGWLRRNPNKHQYNDEMCPCVKTVPDSGHGGKNITVNECSEGENCSFAHSTEEILYHPKRYKTKTCQSASQYCGCVLGDVCPKLHPAETYRTPKKVDARPGIRQHGRSGQPGGQKTHGMPPLVGAPTVFVDPAPKSSFENHLLLPGLQQLYRRQCLVFSSQRKENSHVLYSYF